MLTLAALTVLVPLALVCRRPERLDRWAAWLGRDDWSPWRDALAALARVGGRR